MRSRLTLTGVVAAGVFAVGFASFPPPHAARANNVSTVRHFEHHHSLP
jgi:hypothetical protein